MASAISPCVYKTVTLAVGEIFTLPPGAELIASSGGLQAITSTCTLPKDLETIKRYRIQWELESPNSGTDAWEDGGFSQVIIAGVTYPMPIAAYDGQNNVVNFLQSINAPFSNYYTTSWYVGSAKYFKIEFDAIPSIADSTLFYIYVYGTGTNMEIIPYNI